MIGRLAVHKDQSLRSNLCHCTWAMRSTNPCFVFRDLDWGSHDDDSTNAGEPKFTPAYSSFTGFSAGLQPVLFLQRLQKFVTVVQGALVEHGAARNQFHLDLNRNTRKLQVTHYLEKGKIETAVVSVTNERCKP